MTLAILGSGRPAGASTRLAAAAAEAASGEAQMVALDALAFRGCSGCRSCRHGAPGCVLRDDLSDLLAATASADALILASPIYYGYVSGQLKSYLDRWYSWRDGSGALRWREGRPALLILTQGHPDAGAYDWTRNSLERVLRGYGFRPSVLVASGMAPEEDAPLGAHLLARARELGSALGAPGTAGATPSS